LILLALAAVTEPALSKAGLMPPILDRSARNGSSSRAATEGGLFAQEIVAVEIAQKKGDPRVVARDEEPFRADLSKMGGIKPAFDKAGSVTAANASKINDGAAALVLTTAEHAARLGRRPIARILAHASVAQKPEWFTTAPVAATRKVLERAGLTVAEIDLFEINEAFAVVALACMRDLALDPEKVNVRGGAVALGHPIGASGARILTTLLSALAERDGRFGCAAICIGGGADAASGRFRCARRFGRRRNRAGAPAAGERRGFAAGRNRGGGETGRAEVDVRGSFPGQPGWRRGAGQRRRSEL
jgi:acetyl-CoA acetyltransferase